MPSRADCKLFLCYRTARGDNNGTALSFVTSDDHKLLSKAEEELTKECTGAWECSDSLQQHVMISLYIIKKMQNRTTQGLPLAIFLAIFFVVSQSVLPLRKNFDKTFFSVTTHYAGRLRQVSGISGDGKGIRFVNKRYTEGLPFLSKMVCIIKIRVRGWTSRWSLPGYNSVELIVASSGYTFRKLDHNFTLCTKSVAIQVRFRGVTLCSFWWRQFCNKCARQVGKKIALSDAAEKLLERECLSILMHCSWWTQFENTNSGSEHWAVVYVY